LNHRRPLRSELKVGEGASRPQQLELLAKGGSARKPAMAGRGLVEAHHALSMAGFCGDLLSSTACPRARVGDQSNQRPPPSRGPWRCDFAISAVMVVGCHQPRLGRRFATALKLCSARRLATWSGVEARSILDWTCSRSPGTTPSSKPWGCTLVDHLFLGLRAVCLGTARQRPGRMPPASRCCSWRCSRSTCWRLEVGLWSFAHGVPWWLGPPGGSRASRQFLVVFAMPSQTCLATGTRGCRRPAS